MNRIAISALLLALLLPQVQRASAAGPEVPNTPASYPWSESSPFVRVPRTFLNEVNIFSVTISNSQTMEFALTDDFIQTFALKGSEVDQVTASINRAIDEVHTEKAKHFVANHEPVDVGVGRANPKIVEKFAFRLQPFPDEKAAILNKLKEQVLSILGKERSEWFWRYGGMLDNNEMQGFGPKSPPPEGMTSTSTYTFALQEGTAGLEISLYHTTVSSGRGAQGSGMAAGPYPPALDRYAPEPMKLVLERWRKLIADNRGSATGTPKAEEGLPARGLLHEAAAHDPGPQERQWQDGALFVDLPKRLITSFRIAGLTVDDEISPEARTLFGLTDSEAKAVTALYAEMKDRFEQIERSHLERTKPTEYSFVIRAFPEQAKALQTEWLQKLRQTIGTNRAELLDRAIRTPIHPHFARRGVPGGDFLRVRQKGPGWLLRGMAETQIELTVDKGVDGQPVIERMEWSVGGEGGERGNIGVAPGAGGMKTMPERWRHLITPDILTMPPLL